MRPLRLAQWPRGTLFKDLRSQVELLGVHFPKVQFHDLLNLFWGHWRHPTQNISKHSGVGSSGA